MKIALAQLDMGFENPPFAQNRCMEMMAEAAKQQADCIVFPEMTLTGRNLGPEQKQQAHSIPACFRRQRRSRRRQRYDLPPGIRSGADEPPQPDQRGNDCLHRPRCDTDFLQCHCCRNICQI